MDAWKNGQELTLEQPGYEPERLRMCSSLLNSKDDTSLASVSILHGPYVLINSR